jgi:hypothetical protein
VDVEKQITVGAVVDAQMETAPLSGLSCCYSAAAATTAAVPSSAAAAAIAVAAAAAVKIAVSG